MPRGVYAHVHIKPRVYPAEIVDMVVGLYSSGSTVLEVQAALPPGYKAQRIIERHIPQRRRAAPRDQTGAANATWRGDDAGYAAMHRRVEAARGKPSVCTECGSTSAPRYEWANLTGRYENTNDYARMCVSCHRRYDAARRAATGRRTMPAGGDA